MRSGRRAGGTAGGRRDTTCPGGRWSSRAVARPASSSDSTSSSTSTGVEPVRSATRRWAARRNDSASVRCSPCEACVRAGRPPIVSPSSSRCGPTVETPRLDVGVAGPAERRRQAADAPRRVVVHADLRGRARQLRVGLPHHRAQAFDQRVTGVPEAVADIGQPGVPHVERHGRRLVEPTSGLAQQHVALANDPVELEAEGVVLHRERDEGVVHEAAAGRRGHPSPASGRRARTR